MQRSLIFFLALVLPIMQARNPSRAATFTYTDGVCEHRVVYDAKKVDGRQLKVSFDYLAGSEILVEPSSSYFSTAEEIAAVDSSEFHQRCAASRRRIAMLDLIALPGLDELRRGELAALDATCVRTEAALAAAKGDVAPARAYAAACTRYTDLLELPASKLKAQWNDLVVDLCQASTQRNICAGELQRRGEGPGSETRRRMAVLTRWSECATRSDGLVGTKQELLQELARRYKTNTTSCAR